MVGRRGTRTARWPGTAHPRDPVDRASVAGSAAAAAAVEIGAEPAVTADPRAAAFFDVDNTVMQGASIFHLARGLYRRKFFSRGDIARFAWQQATFRLVGAENLEKMGRARDTALSFIAGRSVAELSAIGEEVFDEFMAAKVWPGTQGLARMHVAAGQRVWLVTATPVEVAAVIARRLGLTGALGTVAESREGVYTGALVGEPLHGPAKAEAVRALAAREGLELSRCAAYSDSSNDIPMLALVGHPCAINPDRKLRAHARAQGWRIRDYRTGRRAVRLGLPTAAGAWAVSRTIAHRRRKHRFVP